MNRLPDYILKLALISAFSLIFLMSAEKSYSYDNPDLQYCLSNRVECARTLNPIPSTLLGRSRLGRALWNRKKLHKILYFTNREFTNSSENTIISEIHVKNIFSSKFSKFLKHGYLNYFVDSYTNNPRFFSWDELAAGTDLEIFVTEHFSKRQKLIYVHGNNNTFYDSARSLAALSIKMKHPAVGVLFSWPSQGVAGYIRTNRSAEKSYPYFNRALSVLENVGVSSLSILAHSHGASIVSPALSARDNTTSSLKFNVITFVAPDESDELFKSSKLINNRHISKVFSIYMNYELDIPLLISSFVHGDRNIKFSDWYADKKIDFIYITDDNSILGHNFLTTSKQFISDFLNTLNYQRRARFRINGKKIKDNLYKLSNN